MKTIKGDLIKLGLDAEFDVIAHGCNCWCSMGAGIAEKIKHTFPEAYAADLETERGDIGKLGTFTSVQFDVTDQDGKRRQLVVANLYTQFNPGRPTEQDPLEDRYNALRSSLSLLNSSFPNARVGLPMIGAGLARGDWSVISGIIDEVAPSFVVVEYKYEQEEIDQYKATLNRINPSKANSVQ